MPSAPVIVYDRDMRKVAYLENAFAIGYDLPFNDLWTAQFSLPANDPKNIECQPLYYVELFDERDRIELFRILPTSAVRSRDGQTITYSCEHVLATFIDDVLFQYHQIGNLGVYTADVLEYILQRQSVQRWQLGTVSFDRQFEYNWENESLLAALISVPKPFEDEYQWTYDTTVFPWRLSLVAPPQGVTAYIRYGVNMQGIEKTVDPSNLCTRLYGLGYGEGVNQLTFKDINGGLPYIQDAAAVAQYGVIQRIFVDRRFETAETLLARCQALYNEMKIPRVTYSVSASEIHRLTGEQIYKFTTGVQVRVQDAEMREDFVARIVNVSKKDMRGRPGEIQLAIANRPQDIAGSIAELANRQRINEVYAQGATNLDSHDFADNADPTHPAVLRLYIPDETARINKMQLSYQVEPFRAYERSIESMPAVTSGPSSTSTTESGGQTTSGPSSTNTTASGGQTTSGPSSTSTTASGGQTTSGPSSTTTTASGGATTSGPSTRETTAAGGGTTQTSTTSTNWDQFSIFVPDATSVSGTHDHGINAGTVLLDKDGGWHTWVPSGAHSHALTSDHRHEVTIPPHSHGMDHTHFIGPHTHGMDHTHNIAAHTHGMDHTHEIAGHVHGMDHTHEIAGHVHGMDHTHVIPAHTHGIEYGIFEGPTPSVVMVRVDGNLIAGLGTSVQDIDIIPYLSKDNGGKVTRGWHEIKITPNSLGRIVANVNSQIFVQSRGGGDY